MAKISERIKEVEGKHFKAYLTPKTLARVVEISGVIPLAMNPDASPREILAKNTMVSLLDEGTTKRTKEKIAKFLDERGATLRFYADGRQLWFTIRCLREHIADVLSLAGETLQTPSFPVKSFASKLIQQETELKHLLDDTRDLAYTKLTQQLYPKSHWNYRYHTKDYLAALRKISRKDIFDSFKRHTQSGELLLAATGDFDARELVRALREAFGWRVPVSPAKTAPQVTGSDVAGKESRIEVAHKTSVDLFIGSAVPVDARNPDLDVLHLIRVALGSGFTSRLWNEIREKRGLTYHASAQIDGFRYDTSGSWYVYGSFAPSLYEKGKDAMLEVLTDVYENGLTEKEIADTKKQMLGRTVVGYSSPIELQGAVLSTVLNKWPLSRLDRWPSRIKKITKADVDAVIQKYMNPKKVAIVASGTFEKATK